MADKVAERTFKGSITTAIVNFLVDIGLEVRFGEIAGRTFLPGIIIEQGTLRIDEAQLKYPGDLLHEAGHLALKSPGRRKEVQIDAGKSAGEEMGAIAWSYAALVHLQLDPAIVFHADGYRGGSTALIDNFAAGRYIGVPILQWRGLAAESQLARELGVTPYPQMIKWLRDE